MEMEGGKEEKSFSFLSFTVEPLINIREKVQLRYVSQTRQVVSETPSLWSEFVWALYDSREERSVMKVLKACGDYIKLS